MKKIREDKAINFDKKPGFESMVPKNLYLWHKKSILLTVIYIYIYIYIYISSIQVIYHIHILKVKSPINRGTSRKFFPCSRKLRVLLIEALAFLSFVSFWFCSSSSKRRATDATTMFLFMDATSKNTCLKISTDFVSGVFVAWA